MSTETMTTTTPSADAPHLTRAQTDYIALTAPEDAMREDVITAIAEEWGHARARVAMNPGTPLVVPFHEMTTAAIAAAEPHMRAKHRAELFAELIEAAKTEAVALSRIRDAIPNVEWRETIQQEEALERAAEWLEDCLNEEATRPVDERGDR